MIQETNNNLHNAMRHIRSYEEAADQQHHISFKDFALGTLLGLVPGLVAIALFADGLVHSIRDPDISSFTWLTVVVLIIALAAFGLRKWLRRRQAPTESQEDS